jgi:hypothetical protein
MDIIGRDTLTSSILSIHAENSCIGLLGCVCVGLIQEEAAEERVHREETLSSVFLWSEWCRKGLLEVVCFQFVEYPLQSVDRLDVGADLEGSCE